MVNNLKLYKIKKGGNTMKKIIAIALALVLVLSFAACSNESDEKTIKVGASPAPHAEILEVANNSSLTL